MLHPSTQILLQYTWEELWGAGLGALLEESMKAEQCLTSAAPYTTPAVMALSKSTVAAACRTHPSSQHRVVQQTSSSAITSLRAPNKPNIQVTEYYQPGRKGNLEALCSCLCNTAKAGSFSMACFIAVFGLVQCETQQLLLCNQTLSIQLSFWVNLTLQV